MKIAAAWPLLEDLGQEHMRYADGHSYCTENNSSYTGNCMTEIMGFHYDSEGNSDDKIAFFNM